MSRRSSLLGATAAVLVSLLLVGAVLGGVAVAAQNRHRVPQGFVGVTIDGPVFPDMDGDLAGQMNTMVASGVESVRAEFDWAQAEPQRNVFDWTQLDELVGTAAQLHLSLLPVVVDAPAWDADANPQALTQIPKSPGPYAKFLTALIERYGPQGTFWQSASPQLPIRTWEVWNEPSIPAFWWAQPFEKRYVSLLRAASKAIRRADPGATVVLAGLPNFSWRDLAKIYAVHGARQLFDVVAVHPYTKQPRGVITILQRVRKVMNAEGDARKSIVADEVSWPSSKGHTTHTVGLDFATTEAGQAKNLGRLLPLLAHYRVSLGLMGFYWYTWAGYEHDGGLPFQFAGLFRYNSGQYVAKPAYRMFRRRSLALEDCRQKGPLATQCLKAG